jgi:hypothetical protein
MTRSTVLSPETRDQQMQMVRHDYEIMQLKFSFLAIETKHIDQERSVAVRLSQRLAHACLRGYKKPARRTQDSIPARIALRVRHPQGLKPDSFP